MYMKLSHKWSRNQFLLRRVSYCFHPTPQDIVRKHVQAFSPIRLWLTRTCPSPRVFWWNCDLVTVPRAFSSIFVHQTCLNCSCMVGHVRRCIVFTPLPKWSYKNTSEHFHASSIDWPGHVQVGEFFDEKATSSRFREHSRASSHIKLAWIVLVWWATRVALLFSTLLPNTQTNK